MNDTQRMTKEQLLAKARRVAQCVYIATEETVAKDIADTIHALIACISGEDDPNEGPVANGLVQIEDGVLPAFYNRWKCSQCGRDPRDVQLNGCGYSQSCGRTAATKEAT